MTTKLQDLRIFLEAEKKVSQTHFDKVEDAKLVLRSTKGLKNKLKTGTVIEIPILGGGTYLLKKDPSKDKELEISLRHACMLSLKTLRSLGEKKFLNSYAISLGFDETDEIYNFLSTGFFMDTSMGDEMMADCFTAAVAGYKTNKVDGFDLKTFIAEVGGKRLKCDRFVTKMCRSVTILIVCILYDEEAKCLKCMCRKPTGN